METAFIAGFPRHPGPIALNGLLEARFDGLRERLEATGAPGSFVMSDLTLGAWQGHQAAREFAEQLTRRPQATRSQPRGTTLESRRVDISYADVIGDFIDAEAQGERTITEALAFAEQIRRMVLDAPRAFLVWVPRFGLGWETEDAQFVRFLMQACLGTPSKVLLLTSGANPPQVPRGWRVRWHAPPQPPEFVATSTALVELVPGIITQDVFETLTPAGIGVDSLTQIDAGHWLVPPENRRDPRQVSRLDFDRLGSLARSHGWLDAYAATCGNSMFVEPWLLYAEAQQRFAEGAPGISVRLMDHAVRHARSVQDWGIMQSFAQGLRLAMRRFAEASRLDQPSEALPVETRRFLLESKGWGLVMTGALDVAETCFQGARGMTDPDDRDGREYLYLLNISALCRLKSGDPDGALEMERAIERAIQRLPMQDRRLEYVNSINLARLHRLRNDFTEAERYFCAAFRTTLGLRSDGDAIYTNMLLGRLFAQTGRPKEALACWMRAALHWCSSDAPEAVGPRVVNAIIGGRDDTENRVEGVSAALIEAVTQAAALVGLDPSDDPSSDSRPFVSTARLQSGTPGARCSHAVLVHGVSVFASRHPAAPSIDGPITRRLRSHLMALLALGAPPGFLKESPTIVVDAAFGREIPSTWEEVLPGCVRLGVTKAVRGGDVVTFSSSGRLAIERGLRVRMGLGVERLEHHEDRAIVVFKRYRLPRVLTLDESRLLSFARATPILGDLVDIHGPSSLGILRELEVAGVIYLEFQQDGAADVSPLSATTP